MRFSSLRLTGHQRSGTHYVAAVISLNFLGSFDYKNIYLNHKLPEVVKIKNIGYLYVFRNFNDVANSVFKMRGRFGLQANDFNSFLNTKYNKMWSNEPYNGINIYDVDGRHKTDFKVSNYFKKIKHTPKEWWTRYYKSWEKAERKKPNVIKVSYDHLINDFEAEMTHICRTLACPKPLTGFKNIERRIGWIP